MLLAIHVTLERACQIRPLPEGRSDENILGLVLLDTESGERQTLVSGVTWNGPKWSEDGCRVQYEVRVPEIGFVNREIDIETRVVRDLKPDNGDVPSLPGFTEGTEI